MKVRTDLQAKLTGNTLEVHSLILYTSTAVGTGLNTGWETKIPLLQGQKTKEKKENFLNQIKMLLLQFQKQMEKKWFIHSLL